MSPIERVITEQTKLPLGLVLTIVVLIVTGSSVAITQASRLEAVESRQNRQGEYALGLASDVKVLLDRTARIEADQKSSKELLEKIEQRSR